MWLVYLISYILYKIEKKKNFISNLITFNADYVNDIFFFSLTHIEYLYTNIFVMADFKILIFIKENKSFQMFVTVKKKEKLYYN